jgi:nicotinamidase-related amidase
LTRAPASDDPATIAVLCVECQNGVLGTESVLPALARDCVALVAHIRRLLDAARAAGAHIVHATYGGALGAQPVGTARIWRTLTQATAGWHPASPATQVIPELLTATDIVLPRHHGLFPTQDAEVIPVLRGLGVQTVVLAGVSLNLALPHTAADLTQAGLRVVVPREAVGGTPPSYANQVLIHTMGLLGLVTGVDELIAKWNVDGRQPEPSPR